MTDYGVILGAKRTAIGAFQGCFADTPAPALGAQAIIGAMQDAGVDKSQITEVFMGCVLSAGLGQAPARQATIGAGLPVATPSTTINKVCGSGLQSVILASTAIAAGQRGFFIAGGMENMTRAPYLSCESRGGARLGHVQMLDHMFLDGLEDAYEKGTLMGCYAEATAGKYNITRAAQDEFTLQSLTNALDAQKSGMAGKEIIAVELTDKRGTKTMIDTDETPGRARPDKIPHLKPAFAKGGTVTPANSSSISDGAAALVLGSADDTQGLPIRARIVGHSSHACAPEWFTTAPIGAIKTLLARLDWSSDSVDLWEINEAFAVVPLACMQELGIARDRVNIFGGAVALGHPIGASGARVLVSLINALECKGLRRGIAAVCIGGGEAVAVAIEVSD
ncbi:MAG: thiolase family protein [Proteobacteria bacterium]|nr:thiolase family protein [Pseudomonadota bacterium]